MTRATVRWFSDEEGWGVLDTPEAPDGVFVHFGAIEMDGYQTLAAGQVVDVELEGPLAQPLEIEEDQSFRFSAKRVQPISS